MQNIVGHPHTPLYILLHLSLLKTLVKVVEKKWSYKVSVTSESGVERNDHKRCHELQIIGKVEKIDLWSKWRIKKWSWKGSRLQISSIIEKIELWSKWRRKKKEEKSKSMKLHFVGLKIIKDLRNFRSLVLNRMQYFSQIGGEINNHKSALELQISSIIEKIELWSKWRRNE